MDTWVDTVSWTGTYSTDVEGTAFGNLIVDGPLSGLNVKIERLFQMEFGEDGELVNLTENQSVNRVISPSIISASDNTAPSVDAIALSQGVVVGENGAPGYLEVTVSDIDFNIVSVFADTTSIGGLAQLSLNDRGLNGDRVIGDDIWTAEISVPGLQVGEMPVSVTVTDAFDATDSADSNITVLNQAPRLTEIEIVPSIVHRGEAILVNAHVYDAHGVSNVSIDMREYGGDVTELKRVGEIWAGQIEIPGGISPGERMLSVRMVDSLGAAIIVQATTTSAQYHIPSNEDREITIDVMNEPPLINIGELRDVEIGDEDVEYTLTIAVEDYDGLNWVRVKLGILAPPGQSNTWFTMTSNGNGTYSKQFTVKTYIALGTHEVLVKAMDAYGSQSSEESVPIKLQAPEDSSSTTEASSTMTYIALGGLGVLAIVGAAIYVMRGSDKEGGFGGFGDA